jgi:hypothetical protein
MATGTYISVPIEVELVAEPKSGYAFDRWEVTSASTVAFDSGSNSATTYIDCRGGITNVEITAHFKMMDVSLTVISTNNWGSPMAPAVGVSTWASASNISASVTTPFDLRRRWDAERELPDYHQLHADLAMADTVAIRIAGNCFHQPERLRR